MIPPGRARVLMATALLIALGFLGTPTSAQSGVTVHASLPEISNFPEISIFLSVSDATGRRIPGIPASSFSVLEDGTPIEAVSVDEIVVGTRQIFVVNSTIGLRIRDSLGRSRFDFARQALMDWWQQSEPSRIDFDDLSLISANGVLVAHSTSGADLASALDHHSPSFEDTEIGFELVLQALDFASDALPNPGMPTYLFFFTALVRAPRVELMTNVVSRASSTSTTIYPVLVGPPESLDQPEVAILQELADATGGRLVYLDPTNGLFELADQIVDQRTQYRLTYPSRINQTGEHQVQAQVVGVGLEMLSEIRTLTVDVQPPIVEFSQPPSEIVRSSQDASQPLEAYLPVNHALQIITTFPDNHLRRLVSSQLIVDGEVHDQNSSPPFDRFVWDLSNTIESRVYNLQVVVEDELGLQGMSPTLPIQLEVLLPPTGIAALRPALGSLLAALGVLVAGVVLAAAVISIGRRSTSEQQPASRKTERPRRPRRASLRRPMMETPPEATLHPLMGEDPTNPAIPLFGLDVIIGADPSLAAVPLEDPSVSGMHARLVRQVDGGYLLKDQGSEAGTWVNFEPISDEGSLLKHGDIIYFGLRPFRFQMAVPPPPADVRITPIESTDKARSSREEDPS